MTPEAQSVDNLSKATLAQMGGMDIPQRLAVCSNLMSLVLFEGGLIHNRDAVEMAISIMDQCVKAYGESLTVSSH